MDLNHYILKLLPRLNFIKRKIRQKTKQKRTTFKRDVTNIYQYVWTGRLKRPKPVLNPCH